METTLDNASDVADESYSPAVYVVATSIGTSVLLMDFNRGTALRAALSREEHRCSRNTIRMLAKLQRKRLAIRATLRRLHQGVRSARRLRARLASLDDAVVRCVASLPLSRAWLGLLIKRIMDGVMRLESTETDFVTISETLRLPVRHLKKFASSPADIRTHTAASLHVPQEKWNRVMSDVLLCVDRTLRCEESMLADAAEIHLLGECIRAIRGGTNHSHGERNAPDLDSAEAEPAAVLDEALIEQLVSHYQQAGTIPLEVLCSALPATASLDEVNAVFAALAQHHVEILVGRSRPRQTPRFREIDEWALPIHLVRSRVRVGTPGRDERPSLVEDPHKASGPAPTPATRFGLKLREVSTPVVALDLEAVQRTLLEKARTLLMSTFVPARRDRRAPMWRPRRVPLVQRCSSEAQGAASASTSLIGATTADVGQLGESLVFSMMMKRWVGAVSADRSHVNALLRHIADEYWSCDEGSREAVEAALCSAVGEDLFAEPVIRAMLWPSRTVHGDWFGFDIFGLEDDLRSWMCVEVKTTLGPPTTTFQWTANEYARARHEGDRYALARVARIHTDQVSVHIWRDPIALLSRGELVLTPESYVVSLGARDQATSESHIRQVSSLPKTGRVPHAGDAT